MKTKTHIEIDPSDYSSYRVTGIMTNGKRFSIQTIHLWHAWGINLWRGSVWGVDWHGKRTLLKRVN